MQSISYEITPVSINEHLFCVDINIPTHSMDVLTLSLPAWIPGSYMIRDFAKNLHRIGATADNKGQQTSLSMTQLDKQSWQLQTQGQACQVTYVVYAFDLSVRSAYLSDEYGFFNGTSTFLQVVELNQATCSLTIHHGCAPQHWQIATSLALQSNDTSVQNHTNIPTQYMAQDYNELIDHPVIIGDYLHHSFEVAGVKFHMVLTGNPHTDIHKICEDLVPICHHHLSLFGSIPCKEYWFLTLLSDDGFGGLEHRASTALLFPRFHLPQPNEFETRSEQYQQFLSLCSHELFHTWHVKSTRPQNMLSPDLSTEVYTEQLWIYEGFTSLYDDLSLARANIISPQRYTQILAENLTRLLRTPGRHFQTVAQSSFDAWTKFYKQDAGSINHIVSYYNKGAIVSLCLDITLRQLSQNKVTLDTLLQALWQQYGKDQVGTPDDVITHVCQQSFGINIKPFLDIAVHTTMDLPVQTLLQEIGLSVTMRAKQSNTDKGGTHASVGPINEFGAIFKANDTGITIVSVVTGSAASDAGLQPLDTVIAINNWQINAENVLKIINGQRVDDSDDITNGIANSIDENHAALHVLRQGRLLQLSLPIRPAPLDTCMIAITDATKFSAWLGV